jgi:hypothetical protein
MCHQFQNSNILPCRHNKFGRHTSKVLTLWTDQASLEIVLAYSLSKLSLMNLPVLTCAYIYCLMTLYRRKTRAGTYHWVQRRTEGCAAEDSEVSLQRSKRLSFIPCPDLLWGPSMLIWYQGLFPQERDLKLVIHLRLGTAATSGLLYKFQMIDEGDWNRRAISPLPTCLQGTVCN